MPGVQPPPADQYSPPRGAANPGAGARVRPRTVGVLQAQLFRLAAVRVVRDGDGVELPVPLGPAAPDDQPVRNARGTNVRVPSRGTEPGHGAGVRTVGAAFRDGGADVSAALAA